MGHLLQGRFTLALSSVLYSCDTRDCSMDPRPAATCRHTHANFSLRCYVPCANFSLRYTCGLLAVQQTTATCINCTCVAGLKRVNLKLEGMQTEEVVRSNLNRTVQPVVKLRLINSRFREATGMHTHLVRHHAFRFMSPRHAAKYSTGNFHWQGLVVITSPSYLPHLNTHCPASPFRKEQSFAEGAFLVLRVSFCVTAPYCYGSQSEQRRQQR